MTRIDFDTARTLAATYCALDPKRDADGGESFYVEGEPGDAAVELVITNPWGKPKRFFTVESINLGIARRQA